MVTKLEQSILDEQKQLEELTNKSEDKTSEKLVDEVIADSDKDKEVVEEKEPDKEANSIETDEERQKRENDLHARERISKKELRKQLDAKNIENARLEGFVAAAVQNQNKPQIEAKSEEVKDVEPDKDLDPDAHIRWELRQERAERLKLQNDFQQVKLREQMNEGKAEIRAFEEAFKVTDSEYSSAKEYLIQGTFNQVKAANPGVSDALIKKEVERLEIIEAAKAVKMGYDPALHFKMMAIRNGWQPQPKDSSKEEKPEIKSKIDLKTLEINKKKTANLIDGSSRGKVGDPSSDELVNMTIRDLAKIEDSVWKRI